MGTDRRRLRRLVVVMGMVASLLLAAARPAFAADPPPDPVVALQTLDPAALDYQLLVTDMNGLTQPHEGVVGYGAVTVPVIFTVPSEGALGPGMSTFSVQVQLMSVRPRILNITILRGLAGAPVPLQDPCARVRMSVVLQYVTREHGADVGLVRLGYEAGNAPSVFLASGVQTERSTVSGVDNAHVKAAIDVVPPCGAPAPPLKLITSQQNLTGNGFQAAIPRVPQPYHLDLDVTRSAPEPGSATNPAITTLRGNVGTTTPSDIGFVVDELRNGQLGESLFAMTIRPLPRSLDFVSESRKTSGPGRARSSTTVLSFDTHRSVVDGVTVQARIDDTCYGSIEKGYMICMLPQPGFDPRRTLNVELLGLPYRAGFTLANGRSDATPADEFTTVDFTQMDERVLDFASVNGSTIDDEGRPQPFRIVLGDTPSRLPGDDVPNFHAAVTKTWVNTASGWKAREEILATPDAPVDASIIMTAGNKKTTFTATVPERLFICSFKGRGCAPDVEFANVQALNTNFVLDYAVSLRIEASRPVPVTLKEEASNGTIISDLQFTSIEHFALAKPTSRSRTSTGRWLQAGLGLDTDGKFVRGRIQAEKILLLQGFSSEDYAIYRFSPPVCCDDPTTGYFPAAMRGRCLGVVIADGQDVCFGGEIELLASGISALIGEFF